MRGALADRLRRFAGDGLLRVDDPDRAAVHLLLLISVFEPSYRALVPTEAELTAMVTAGVHAFLHGYGS